MIAAENPLCFAEPTRDPRLVCSRDRTVSKGGTRKLRSRSSPVRPGTTLDEGVRRRQRSPSASSSRPSPGRIPSPFADLDELCCHNVQDNDDELFKPAYFCKWPPAEPLRVVVLGGDKPCLPSTLKKPSLPPTPYTDASPSPPPRRIHLPRARKRQDNGRRSSRHLVHGLLANLTDNLPLAVSVPPSLMKQGAKDLTHVDDSSYLPHSIPTKNMTQDQRCDDDAISNSKDYQVTKDPSPKEEHHSRRDRSSSKPTQNASEDDSSAPDNVIKSVNSGSKNPDGDDTDSACLPVTGTCRNVAVQAKISSRGTRNSATKPARELQGDTKAVPAEVWIGDVRTLRDSHVRLVRQQLRHIAHLNRALDRVGRYQKSESIQPSRLGRASEHVHANDTMQANEAMQANVLQRTQSMQSTSQRVQPTTHSCRSPKREKSIQSKQKRQHSRLNRARQ